MTILTILLMTRNAHATDYMSGEYATALKSRGVVDIVDAGLEDYCPVINDHIDAAVGSGVLIRLGPGVFPIRCSIVLDTYVSIVGAGRGTTVIDKQTSADAFISNGFSTFYNDPAANLYDAPRYMSVKDLTIEGNYLDGAWNGSATGVLYSSGSGIVIFGSQYEIDVEINNIPGHALRLAGWGGRSGLGIRSIVRLDGRVSGGRAIDFKGPGDIVFEHVIYGLTNLDPRSDLTDTYPGAA